MNSQDSAAQSPPQPFWRNFRQQYCFIACLGALLIGVTLPTALVCWNCAKVGALWTLRAIDAEAALRQSISAGTKFEECIQLLTTASVLCGSWGVVFAGVLYFGLKGAESAKAEDANRLLRIGAGFGILLSFANAPGYFAYKLLIGQWPVLRLMCLFIVSGASCGAWIAWQAYRANHAEARVLPRYSLSTLLLVVLLWAGLLAIYAP